MLVRHTRTSITALAVSTCAAEGVRSGIAMMVLHQRFFNLMLDEFEREALAVQN